MNQAGVIVFPGSNCDKDLGYAFELAGFEVVYIWHKDSELPNDLDIVALPGGFSFGDYLRCGAIAAKSPITRAVIDFAEKGGYVLGICNGFQILCESFLLPGTLVRNWGGNFLCRSEILSVESTNSVFTSNYKQGERISVPIAHHDGNYVVNEETLKVLTLEDRVAFKYLANPNGSCEDIAGVFSKNRRVLGMMPHPERAVMDFHGSRAGMSLFSSLLGSFVSA